MKIVYCTLATVGLIFSIDVLLNENIENITYTTGDSDFL